MGAAPSEKTNAGLRGYARRLSDRQQRQHVIVDQVQENVDHHDRGRPQDKAQGKVAFRVSDFIGRKSAIVPAIVSPECCDHSHAKGGEKAPPRRRRQSNRAVDGPVHEREAKCDDGDHRTHLGAGQDGLHPASLAHTAIVYGRQNDDRQAGRQLLLPGMDGKEIGQILCEAHGYSRYAARLHRQKERPAAQEAHQMPVSLAEIYVLAAGLRQHGRKLSERQCPEQAEQSGNYPDAKGGSFAAHFAGDFRRNDKDGGANHDPHDNGRGFP